MITTNLEFTEWTSILGDEKMIASLLDRLTNRAHILLLNGESYRFRQSRNNGTMAIVDWCARSLGYIAPRARYPKLPILRKIWK
nr:ATP-binding protein [Bacillus sp. X1(2014)]